MDLGVASLLSVPYKTRSDVPRNPGDNKPGIGPGNGSERKSNRHDGGTGTGRDNTPGQPPYPTDRPRPEPKE